MKPIRRIPQYQQNFKKEILEFINNPVKYDDEKAQEIQDKIKSCCLQKISLDYQYDGNSRCEISGKYIAEDDKVTIDNHNFTNTELQRQVQRNGIVDFSIDFIDIFNYEGNKIIELELNDENLKKMYCENVKQMRQESQKYFQEKQQDRNQNLKFICPITNKEHYTALEGVFYNNELYSIEGIKDRIGKDTSQAFTTVLRREAEFIDKLIFRQQQELQRAN